jgi:ankyrin repeat protein
VKNGVDINDKNDYGQTALMLAVIMNENPAIISLLLNFGADATLEDNNRKKAIDYMLIARERDIYHIKNNPTLLQEWDIAYTQLRKMTGML